MDALFGKTINLLSGILDYRAARHKVILSNVANIDTEGYKPSDVTFKQIMGETNSVEMSSTDPKHFGPKEKEKGSIRITTSEDKVNIDTEMVNLAENHLMYNMTVDMLSRKIKGINTILKEAK